MDETTTSPAHLTPISILGQAILEDVRASLQSTHKALLMARRDDVLVLSAALGIAGEDALRGEGIALGDGFLGWVAASGMGQVRANVQFVPPGAPPLASLEVGLNAKSALAVPFLSNGDVVGLVAVYVCHGFSVFTLEDLDSLERVVGPWTDRYMTALTDEESQQWLTACAAPFGPTPETPDVQTGEGAGGDIDEAGSDYTAQDVEVLLSVFGMDLTTKSPDAARVLKADVGDILRADVGEFMRRDVKDVFSANASRGSGAPSVGEPPADQVDESGSEAAGLAAASAADPGPPEGWGSGPMPETEKGTGEEHYSTEEVGRILSVFGVKVNAGDSALTRALGADVGDILTRDVGSLIRDGAGEPAAPEPAAPEPAAPEPAAPEPAPDPGTSSEGPPA